MEIPEHETKHEAKKTAKKDKKNKPDKISWFDKIFYNRRYSYANNITN
jgi:hypothetical protein